MTANVGTIDRAVRLVMGIALIAFAILGVFPNTGWNWVGWIGAIPIVTAIVGNCPAYRIFGISTCKQA